MHLSSLSAVNTNNREGKVARLKSSVDIASFQEDTKKNDQLTFVKKTSMLLLVNARKSYLQH